jgi:hypothetical protein
MLDDFFKFGVDLDEKLLDTADQWIKWLFELFFNLVNRTGVTAMRA